MEKSIQPFNKLLENYLFSVASQFFDQFDEVNQTNLIKLISSIEIDSSPVKSADSGKSSIPNQQLERQWKQVLNTPEKRKKVARKDTFLLEMNKRRMKHYQVLVEQTNLMIHQLELGIENIMERNCGVAQRENLIASYTLLLKRNRDYLAYVISQKKIVSDRLFQL